MTPARTLILDILENADEPLSATVIQKKSGNRFDPATVYRTLHYLEQKGYTESFVLHCREHGTERYYTISSGDADSHHHWFHCERCHRFTDLGGCEICTMLSRYEKTQNIEIHSHVLYLTGICPSCKTASLQK